MQKRSIDFLSVTQIAERLGMSHSGAKFLCITGKLPSHKVGQMYLVHQDDFEDYLKERASTPRKGRWAKREIVDRGISTNATATEITSLPRSSKAAKAKKSASKPSH